MRIYCNETIEIVIHLFLRIFILYKYLQNSFLFLKERLNKMF